MTYLLKICLQAVFWLFFFVLFLFFWFLIKRFYWSLVHISCLCCCLYEILPLSCIMMKKMVKHTLKILRCEHRKIFKACLVIFQHFPWIFQMPNVRVTVLFIFYFRECWSSFYEHFYPISSVVSDCSWLTK